MGIVFGSLPEELCSVWSLTFRRIQLECSVDFVCTYVIESLALVFFRQGFPGVAGCLQERKRAEDIGLCKCERILDRTVHVGLRRKMDYSVDLVVCHNLQHLLEVAYVCLDEDIVWAILYILEIREVAGIGELVDVDYAVVGIVLHEQSHDVAADESRTSGYHYIPFEIHMSYFLIRLIRYWPYWFFIIGCASSSSFCASIHP